MRAMRSLVFLVCAVSLTSSANAQVVDGTWLLTFPADGGVWPLTVDGAGGFSATLDSVVSEDPVTAVIGIIDGVTVASIIAGTYNYSVLYEFVPGAPPPEFDTGFLIATIQGTTMTGIRVSLVTSLPTVFTGELVPPAPSAGRRR